LIDLGIDDDPEATDLLNRAIVIVQQQIEPIIRKESLFIGLSDTNEISGLVATSEVFRLQRATGTRPLNINTALLTALDSASTALQQITHFIEHVPKIDRITLQSLMRVAILGTARTAFVLLPADPDKRLKNARTVLAQDCQSGIRGVQKYMNFNGMPGMAPSPELLEDLQKQKNQLYPKGQPPGETEIINQQTEAFIEALHAAGIDRTFSTDIMRDHASWLWNTYSGLAHAYSWPRWLFGLSRDLRIPGDFPIDLFMTANALLMAIIAYLDRTAAGSAFTTRHVDATTDLT